MYLMHTKDFFSIHDNSSRKKDAMKLLWSNFEDYWSSGDVKWFVKWIEKCSQKSCEGIWKFYKLKISQKLKNPGRVKNILGKLTKIFNHKYGFSFLFSKFIFMKKLILSINSITNFHHLHLASESLANKVVHFI